MGLYEKKKTYKFKMPNNIYYTGVVVKEEEHLILIYTVRGESIQISKQQIIQSWMVGDPK